MDKCCKTIVVTGRIGIVDAALIRYLEGIKNRTERLLINITDSIYGDLITKEHIEEFISALSIVDGILYGESEVQGIVKQRKANLTHLPEKELQQYSIKRVLKTIKVNHIRNNLEMEKIGSEKKLVMPYGNDPSRRNLKVGLVSGSFDLIHCGHIRYIKAARDMADILIVATMSTDSIKQQEKNRMGDRPIYSQEDRIKVLSSLKYVDYIITFEEPDCKKVINDVKPDYFVKCEKDMLRKIVKEECELVEALGGRVEVIKDKGDYSSTDIINYIRRISSRE